MSIASFEPSTLLIVLPEILLLVLAGIILVVGLTSQRSGGLLLSWLTALGLTGILIITLLYGRPGEDGVLIFGGMLRHDWMAFSFKVLFLFAAAMTALLSADVEGVEDRGEYYALLVVATLGMSLMTSSADMIMLFLAIETTSIPLYVLAGFMKADEMDVHIALFAVRSSWIVIIIALMVWSIYDVVTKQTITMPLSILLLGGIVYFFADLYMRRRLSDGNRESRPRV